eukprot:scaffold37367_cov17-Tisochrysis_lutea.AAC.1
MGACEHSFTLHAQALICPILCAYSSHLAATIILCSLQRALADEGRYMRRNSMPLSFTAARQNQPQTIQAVSK